MRWKVTFVDGTQVKVKANNKSEAKTKAESQYGKAALTVREYGE
jgi:hypothetical protein